MFTGIIEQVGQIARTTDNEGNLTVTIQPARMWADVELGESIAVNGTCLTVTTWDAAGFTVDLSRETLAKTAPHWREGTKVNLERAMTAHARFGGHVVSGHVDGVGTVLRVDAQPGAYTMTVRAAPHLARYLVPKGSVAIDGVSLTVNEVDAESFGVNIIPHTAAVTSFGTLQPGDAVNIEIDTLARYVARLLEFRA